MKNSNFQTNKKDDSIFACCFLAPCILGSLIFIIIPILASFSLSFADWNLLDMPKFVGFKNYFELFSSQNFWQVFNNTVIFAIAVTILGTIVPLVLASILANKIRASEFFKTAYFLPFITPMIVIAMVWEWIFDPNIGLLNFILKTHISWLYEPATAMVAIVIVSVWKLVGYNMVIFLAGLSSINSNILEAAKMDGSGSCSTFFRITLPLLSPTIFFVLIITTISSFQVFDLIYLMTQGGPNNATNVLVFWLYQNAFEYFNIGKASAIAYVLFIFISVLTVIQWIIRKKWVYNE
ncbi:MAG: sugar ABC transporter permease [Candidatus Gastranaerophilales bacterium]|nr:sugar ABC transporter permease [Candidatus Gastranaerophilales bacterium]